jgi:uncharacterized Zn finger protein
MCKHIAAVLYGVGARLDSSPELLFALRGVDHLELIAQAGKEIPGGKAAAPDKVLAESDLSSMFDIELAETPTTARAEKTSKRRIKKASDSPAAARPAKGAANATVIGPEPAEPVKSPARPRSKTFSPAEKKALTKKTRKMKALSASRRAEAQRRD